MAEIFIISAFLVASLPGPFRRVWGNSTKELGLA